MKAHYTGERGIRVIRPLIYTREGETKAFATSNRLPVINENCPACFEQPKVSTRCPCLPSLPPSLLSFLSVFRPFMETLHSIIVRFLFPPSLPPSLPFPPGTCPPQKSDQ